MYSKSFNDYIADYPCPVVSYRCRKPAYCEIGHTIMNVLAVSN